MNSLKQLQDCGQSIWLDYIRRDLITSGEFQRLVQEGGVHGVTSGFGAGPLLCDHGLPGDSSLRLISTSWVSRRLRLVKSAADGDLTVAKFRQWRVGSERKQQRKHARDDATVFSN